MRSASVIALDMIWALVVQTKDFATFISAHPRILGIVQSHVYHRGIDELTRCGPDSDDSGISSASPAWSTAVTDQPANVPMTEYSRQGPQPLSGENCTVFLTDVVEFGARTRTDGDRLLIREALFKMTQAVTQGTPGTQSEDRGDGFLPPSVPTVRVIDQLLQELAAALERHQQHPARVCPFQATSGCERRTSG